MVIMALFIREFLRSLKKGIEFSLASEAEFLAKNRPDIIAGMSMIAIAAII